jgi:hypothetical protein
MEQPRVTLKGWERYYRSDKGIWEDTCPHGVGHEDGVHGCDGCCQELPYGNKPINKINTGYTDITNISISDKDLRREPKHKYTRVQYIKKRIPIEVVEWTGKNHRIMYDFLTNDEKLSSPIESRGDNFFIDHDYTTGGLIIKTLEGNMKVSIGDFVARGIKGEFYPIRKDIFLETYELFND